MPPAVDAIANRLGLRPPQRRSLEILARVTEIVPPKKAVDPVAALARIQAELPTVTDFERDFPSLCFALATGVGKTRLMGAFVSYLHAEHGINNFFVLAPGLTVYNKLIDDFTPNTAKYVLKGIEQFSVTPPTITTGENYERHIAGGGRLFPTTINIFNIAKINTEVRGGHVPRIRGFREEIGESYFDYLAGLDDLVLLMDESHHYRATAGLRAINELKPVLGLELTATPFTEGANRTQIPFKNIIFEYSLGEAIADGYVKEPAVITRENFVPSDHSADAIQQIKLEDGVRLHESVKVELETYARQSGQRIVKPFMLIIAQDTQRAADLLTLIKSPAFFDGRYADKVIQVDSSTVSAEEETVARLLKVEDGDEPTEIVIHVNMLKEGWDVTNLYTIVPLRTANARALVVQSVGRGLRLPYGVRTGIKAVDRLNIVAHDRFQEIVDEARRPDFPLRVERVVLTEDALGHHIETVIATPRYLVDLGLADGDPVDRRNQMSESEQAAYGGEDQAVVKLACDAIRRLEARPDTMPDLAFLTRPELQDVLRQEVESMAASVPIAARPVGTTLDVRAIVADTAAVVARRSISIPRIVLQPKGEVRSGFHPFRLDLASLRYPPPSDVLWATYLRTGEFERIGVGGGAIETQSLEDYIVSGLVAFDDVAYEPNAAFLYDLASQVTRHFAMYLTEDDARKALRVHQRAIAEFIHVQMQEHAWQDANVEYDVTIKGIAPLRASAYTKRVDEPVLDFRWPPPDLNNIARYVFGHFAHCLYDLQKFDSDSERKLAVILEREGVKWFKPARGQFQIFYRIGSGDQEYQPDFVAETDTQILMLEPKAANQMSSAEVRAKRDAAVAWCARATAYGKRHGGKPWRYALIPHTRIVENTTLAGLIEAATPDSETFRP